MSNPSNVYLAVFHKDVKVIDKSKNIVFHNIMTGLLDNDI